MGTKQQVLIIGGGTVFEKYEDYLDYLRRYKIEDLKDLKYRDWKRNLEDSLDNGFEVIYPSFPCKRNAKYLEWKIWLEKFFPFLKDNIILIGHSLGGAFWLRYLTENAFPVKIAQLHLVAAPLSGDEEFLGDFTPPKDLSKIAKLAKEIYLYYSQDDPVVSFSNLKEIFSKLPGAEIVVLKGYGHFRVEQFPELLSRLKKIRKGKEGSF